MEHDITRNYTGIEMSQASFQWFFKNFSATEMKAEELTEEITEYQEGDGQNSNILIEKKDSQEAGKKKESNRWELLVFFGFIEIFYSFEEKNVYSSGKKADEIKKEKKECNASD